MMRAAIVLSLLALTACPKKDPGGGAPGGSASGKGGGRAKLEFPVEVMPLATQPLDFTVNTPGTIAAFEQVQIVARVAGAVDKVSFAEGGEVTKGQTLVVIESERYSVLVSQAKTAWDRAKASLKGTEDELKRRKDATKDHPGLITGEEIATYETKVAQAQADVETAQEQLRMAQLNLRDAFVRAPMAGTIQTRTVETGQYVQPGAIMATLLQRDPLLLRFSVTEGDAPRIKPGMIAQFRLRETTRQFTAKITLVAGASDPKSHLVPVTSEVEEKEHQYWLRPGAYCDVVIPVGNPRQAIVIPEMSIRPSDKGFLAYVVENGAAHERVLQLGMHTANGGVEVRDGLKAGEQLVFRGAEPLSENAPVKVVPSSADAGPPLPPAVSAPPPQPTWSGPASSSSAPTSGSAARHADAGRR